MRGSSSTRLEQLTPGQSSKLSAYRDQWAAVRIGPEAGDRDAAFEGVRLAYTAAGLEPPASIEWCGGPAELGAEWLNARSSLNAGANVRSAVIDAVRARVNAGVHSRLGGSVLELVTAGARAPMAETVGTAVVDAVTRRMRDLRRPLDRRFIGALLRLFRPNRHFIGWPTFARAGASSHDLGWLAPHAFLREQCGLVDETAALAGLQLVATNAGWIIPHEKVCWLCARHTVLAIDARGRLHNAAGAALAYPDGWKYYAWKGIEVPGAMLERPRDITIDHIEAEPDVMVRRCLIEIMTPQRFIGLGGAHRGERDEAGTMWRKTWWTGDSWAAVEVVDGTPGPDGVHKHYFLQVPAELRSPRAAVAWSYGLSEQEYRGLVLRT